MVWHRRLGPQQRPDREGRIIIIIIGTPQLFHIADPGHALMQETSPQAEHVIGLLEKKYAQGPDPKIDQEVFSRAVKVLEDLQGCIWCGQPRIAGELLLLLVSAEDELRDWFLRATAAALSSCAGCLKAYYATRRELAPLFSRVYGAETFASLQSRLAIFDRDRINGPLRAFLAQQIDAKALPLLYSLFESLLHPQHLAHAEMSRNFCQTLERLIECKRVVRVTQVLPGLFYCLFESSPAIRHWATSVLENPTLEGAEELTQDACPISTLLALGNGIPGDDLFTALLLITKWLAPIISESDRECLFDALLPALSVPSRFPRALTTIDALLPTFCSRPPHLWELFITSIVRNSELLQEFLATTSDCHLQWPSLLAQHIGASKSAVGLFVLTMQRLSTFLASDGGGSATLWKNATLIGTSLLNEPVLKALSNRITDSLSFLDVCVRRATSSEPCFELRHVSEIVRCCWEAYFVVSARSSPTTQGFEQLLLRLASSRGQRDLVIQTGYAKLAALRRSQLLPTISSGPFLFKALYSASSWEPFARDLSLARVHLLLFILNSGKDYESMRTFLKSYPESYINAFYHAMGVLDADATSTEEAVRRGLEGACELFMETFCSGSFKSEAGVMIIDLFPERENLYRRLITTTLRLCSRTLGLFDSVPRERLLEYERMLSLAVEIRKQLSDSVFNNALQQLPLKGHTISTLLGSFAKYYSVNPTHQPGKTAPASLIGLLIEIATQLDLRISSSAKSMLSIMMETVSLGGGERRRLGTIMDAYEKGTGCLLPRPPLDPSLETETGMGAPVLPPQGRPADPNLEGRVLEGFKALFPSKRQEGTTPPPVLLRSAGSSSAPKAATTSKVGQLRAEVAQMAVGPTFPKRRIFTPSIAKKPQRLDELASSASDSDTEVHYLSSLKRRFEGGSTAAQPAPDGPSGRSVKLIDIAEKVEQGVPRGDRRCEGSNQYQDDCLTKRFQKTLLALNLQDIESVPEDARPVPGSFTSEEHYISVFEPLLYMECRAQLSQSLGEATGTGFVNARITGVAHLDSFHEVTIAGWNLDAEDGRSRLNEQDFLIVKLGEQTPIFGIVVQLGLKAGVFESTIRFLIPPEKAALQLEFREGNGLLFKKIDCLITGLREYLALHAMGRLALSQCLLQPCLASVRGVGTAPEIAALCRTLRMNASQAKAITAVLAEVNPITLIQGPPGTGKTKTIEGLLGALLGKALKQGAIPRKVLLCAPSNAAIDELVRRIRWGLVGGEGGRFSIKVVRVGSVDMMSEQTKDLALEAQVERALAGSMANSTLLLENQRQACDSLRRQLDEAERDAMTEKIKALKLSLWEAKDNLRKNTKFVDDTRASLRQKILKEAHIVCCTLSSSGHDTLSRLDFEYAIIDEACQAVELSCLVPLRHNVRHCVLVGDPNQLPPTVISQAAEAFAYEQSLFTRLQKQCPESVLLLDTQYRMHPDISRFPNDYFYEGRLVDGPAMEQKNSRPWHRCTLLGPFRFFDVLGREDSWRQDAGRESRSRMNEEEARMAANLVAMICANSPISVSDALVGDEWVHC